ncbi:MAG TPA: nuclear transport factor 2 family protein [Bryobacteraceae bacterium]|nr:nuclear transport factor 2 family protein [Bryobacteraceae bacterium]
MTETQARSFAREWMMAWNSHDLNAIMSHYAPEVVLISPVAARLLADSTGTVVGKEALLSYFKQGLQAYPNLSFNLIEVMWGLSSIVLHYVNQNGIKCGEFMELAPDGKVIKVVAHYNS